MAKEYAPCESGRVVAADAEGIALAVRTLEGGGIAAIPTETVYGLAADATSEAAVQSIYRAKGRPAINPLITHVLDAEFAERYVRMTGVAHRLAAHFWPGPLTMVLPLRTGTLAPPVTAGLETAAVRAPAHPVMRAVIAGLGRGVAAPSANRSGRLSPTRAEHVVRSFGAGRVPLVVDGGQAGKGLESTIVSAFGDRVRLLRPGALPVEELARVLGYAPELSVGGKVSAPGMLLRHYAPRLPLRLSATDRRPDELYIGFGEYAGDMTLSASGDLGEAAHDLFAMLHEAEARALEAGLRGLAVAPVPEEGLGMAINDRLSHAARGI